MALAALLCGCVSAPTVRAVRLDGLTIKGNPALEQQLEVDNAICQAEVAKGMAAAAPAIRSRAGEDIFTGCMAQRGYVPR